MKNDSTPAYYWIEKGQGGHGTIQAVFIQGGSDVVTQVPPATGYETDAFTWGYKGSSPKATAAAIAHHFGKTGMVRVDDAGIERLYAIVSSWDPEVEPSITSLELYLTLLGQIWHR